MSPREQSRAEGREFETIMHGFKYSVFVRPLSKRWGYRDNKLRADKSRRSG